VVIGLVVMLAGVGALALVSHLVPTSVAPFAMAGVLLVSGFGSGVVISPNQTLTLAEVPPADGGVAGSLGQLGQRTGTAIGTAVALALFYSTVYTETAAGTADVTVYRDAYGYGLVAVGVALSAALVIGVVDIGRRRRESARAQAGDTEVEGELSEEVS
jgi:MFS family permease